VLKVGALSTAEAESFPDMDECKDSGNAETFSRRLLLLS
jgi:hypothetical protein